MSDTKINPFSGTEYNCYCDYTYTCRLCDAVRERYTQEKYIESLQKWTCVSLEKIAEALKIELPEKPQKPDYD